MKLKLFSPVLTCGFFSIWYQIRSPDFGLSDVKKNIISDSKIIIQFVKEKFNKEFSSDGMVKLLHRLGFEYKQTTLIPGQYDSEKQRNFKETYEARLSTMPEKENLLFIDGVHPQHNTICGKAWIKRGEVKNIESNTGRERINISGAYNPENQDVIIQEDEKLNSESTMIIFLIFLTHYRIIKKNYRSLSEKNCIY